MVTQAKAAGGRVIAVGTTAVRTLESAADDRGGVHALSGTSSATSTCCCRNDARAEIYAIALM